MEEKITFSVSSGNLLYNLQKVSKSILNKSVIPVYGNILFDVKGGVLELTGSSTEIQIETHVNLLMHDGDMRFCVDRSIIDVLKTLPEQPIEFEVVKTEEEKGFIKIKIELRHSTGNIIIPGEDAFGYDKMKEIKGKSFEIPIEKLSRGLLMTKKFAGNDPQRPVSNSVYFDLLGDGAVFVATDNFCVSRFKDKSIKCNDCESFILGIPSVTILLQLLIGFAGVDVHISKSKTNVSFDFGEIKMSCRLTEGRYPNYNSVFPENNDIEMKIDSGRFSAIISRVLISANQQTGSLKLNCTNDKSILSTKDEFIGKSAKEILPELCSREITIGFGGHSLQNILSVISGIAVISFCSPDRAILIKPEKDEEDCELTLLVMPMRVE